MDKWTINTVNNYISEKQPEDLHLEYKAADALAKTDGKKREISIAVSSFANSDGGVLIYGIREGSNHEPDKLDAINSNDYSKEWLEQVINHNISPKIQGINIFPVFTSDDKTSVVYVLEIPKGNTAYQANDKRYYRRYNFQSVQMEDWEIKDIINRQTRTDARVRFAPNFKYKFELQFHPKRGAIYAFDIIATNIGVKAINMLDCIIICDDATGSLFEPEIPYNGKIRELYLTNIEEMVGTINGETVIFNKIRQPILGKTYKRIAQINIRSDFFIDNRDLTIIVTTEDNRTVEKLSAKDIVLIDHQRG